MADSYCYLGIVLHQDGSFKLATNQLRKKALRALFGLKRNIIKSSLSIKSLFALFDSLVKPVILYGCQMIFPHSNTVKYLGSQQITTNPGDLFLSKIAKDPYETFHLKFIKWCLSVHSKACNIACWGDTGRYPLLIESMKLSIDYFKRVKNSNPETLIHKAFLEQEALNLKWYSNMQQITTTFGEGESPKASINCQKNVKKLFLNKWKEAIQISTKMDFYKTLKHNIGFEDYLLLKNEKHRNALTKMRISSHNLYIERGRYCTPPIPRCERFCMYCKMAQKGCYIESEHHVINECSLYDHVRMSTRNHIDSTEATLTSLFVNANNDFNLNKLAGRLSFMIFELHSAFTQYYTDTQYPHQSTGTCILL